MVSFMTSFLNLHRKSVLKRMKCDYRYCTMGEYITRTKPERSRIPSISIKRRSSISSMLCLSSSSSCRDLESKKETDITWGREVVMVCKYMLNLQLAQMQLTYTLSGTIFNLVSIRHLRLPGATAEEKLS